MFNSTEKKQPIQHEIQEIRDFYNKHKPSLYEQTPMNKKTVLKFMETPAYTNIMASNLNTARYQSIKNSDLFESLIDSGMKYSSPRNLASQFSRRFEESIQKGMHSGLLGLGQIGYNNQNFLVNLVPSSEAHEQKDLSFADRVLYGNIAEDIFAHTKSP